MAKRNAYLHVGLPGAGDVVDAAVQQHRTRLAELDVLVPTKAREESFRAAIEIRRRHKEWGYKRKEVEGAWAGVVRRAQKGRSTVLVAQSALAGATAEEIELLCSQLGGMRLHVVVTATAPDGWSEPGDPDRDLASVLSRWAGAVRDPSRLHVLLAPRPDRVGGVEQARRELWRHVGDTVGFGTRSLGVDGLDERPPVPERPLDESARGRLCERVESWREALRAGGYDVRGDLDDLEPAPPSAEDDLTDLLHRTTGALAAAQREVERLGVRNETLEARLAEQESRPRRLRGIGAA